MNDLPNPDVSGAIPADAIVRALAGVVGSVEAAIVRLRGDDAEPDTVEKVLAGAGAPDLGDVVAHHNALTRAIAIVDHRGALPEEEWITVAELGPLLSSVVQRLRAYAFEILGPVEPEITVSAHVALLLTMADDGRFGETLQLLVLVEDATTMWQRLRIERARTAEADERSEVLSAARVLLTEHFEQDGELLRRGRRALARVAEGTPLEVVRRLSSPRTMRTLARLREDLEDFRSACRADAAGWLVDEDPEIADALDSIDSPLKSVGGVLGRGLAKVSDARHRAAESDGESEEAARERD
ncbi:hypothetical protein [Rhodococcus artemisiae]|uniref:Uncharacterized protein n=1 Tax=Rhodococcus artemisiae TaxID=714159 RepID=A0ABU7LKH1_9NOCA|nr:hypothetical protein [Rhodococcus artemisiae]MEE2061407.1 hypothetical protein [Rhodococcus artemisiae]